jgi:uncharacterized protein YrzB (UPF0473 family)
MSEYGNDFITLTDEDGKELELEHLDTLEHDGETYMIFGIEDPDEEDEISVIIMRPVADGDGEMLEEVQDEQLLEEVYQAFLDRIEEDGDEE